MGMKNECKKWLHVRYYMGFSLLIKSRKNEIWNELNEKW
jgi:hypothetical protein